MSTSQVSDRNDPVIESRDQLVAPMIKGEKPRERWRIGTEHEKLVYCTRDHHAPAYDEPGGIRDLLVALQDYGWEPVIEGGNTIALTGSDGAVSLEPAGQLELSGAPLETIHQTCAETGRHLDQVKAIGGKTGKGFLGLGMWPDKTRAELPIMPKGRYEIMLRHMPRVGNLGLDMMLRTCTIQVNLDYSSEADMVQKFRTSLALQPLATAGQIGQPPQAVRRFGPEGLPGLQRWTRLEHQHPQPRLGQHHRGHPAGGAGADHDRVGLEPSADGLRWRSVQQRSQGESGQRRPGQQPERPTENPGRIATGVIWSLVAGARFELATFGL